MNRQKVYSVDNRNGDVIVLDADGVEIGRLPAKGVVILEENSASGSEDGFAIEVSAMTNAQIVAYFKKCRAF